MRLRRPPPSDVIIASTGSHDMGLIDMNARYYVPEVGRFASPDTLNLYPQWTAPALPDDWQSVSWSS